MEAPILPAGGKDRQLSIRRLCQELKESPAFAWFMQHCVNLKNEAHDEALSEHGADRKRARHRYNALNEVVNYVDEQDAQAVQILRREKE